MEQHDTEQEPERRRQILDAALKVFSTKGFHKATNKDIAAEGGMSPGLIYWYFKDKQDLLMSIIRDKVKLLDLVAHAEQFNALPPRDAFRAVARAYLTMFEAPDNVAFFRIVLGEAIRFPQIGEIFYKSIASNFFRLLVEYIDQHIALGEMRPVDSVVAARSFIGMIVVQVLAREVMRQPEAQSVPTEYLVDTITDLYLGGLEARQ